jgi:glyoxylase-like metal-dependent hydrolase (beta-lactamase superfamily II)
MPHSHLHTIAQRPDTEMLAPGFFLIQGPSNSRFPHCNSFLLIGRQTVLIDAGIGAAKIRELDALGRIDVLIISHSHPDHILAWHALADRRILLPQETPASIYDLGELGKRFANTRERARHWQHRVGQGFGVRDMRPPDGRYEDGTLLEAEPFVLEAIHAPGHLDDHYCFIEHSSETLLTTDIDFTGFGPWYGNPESDITAFKESIQKVRRYRHQQVCSSHKPPIRHDTHRAFDDYLQLFERQQESVLALCDPAGTLADMVDHSPFYRNRAPDAIMQQMFEEQMIIKNLALLHQAGRVRRNGSEFIRRR